MPNDAKLALVLGIGLVIGIGVVFFRKEPSTGVPGAEATPAAVTPVRAPGNRSQYRPAQAKVMSQAESTGTAAETDDRATEAPSAANQAP